MMEQSLEVKVNITDYLLTPLSCAAFVNHFLKGLLYQKTQIPYPYAWLKCSIIRRRNREEGQEAIEVNGADRFKIENQFKIASKLYDGLEDAMREVSNELAKNSVREIFIIFGPTPLHPKEICRIQIPSLAMGHFEEVHVGDALKLQHNALRQIFLSDLWMDSIDSSIPCTNTFIFMTKHSDDQSEMTSFNPCKPLNIPTNVKQYTIKVSRDGCRTYSCCRIYDENEEVTEYENAQATTEEEPSLSWYQFDKRLEGYKNTYIGGKGVSEMW